MFLSILTALLPIKEEHLATQICLDMVFCSSRLYERDYKINFIQVLDSLEDLLEIFNNKILNKYLPGLYVAHYVDGNKHFAADENMHEICWS